MDVIAFRLHRDHSVALPPGSAVFVRSGAISWQTRSSDVLLDPNHALLFPATADPAAVTADGGPASLTLICDPDTDFGPRPSARLIDSAAFLEHFYFTLTPPHARTLERLSALVAKLRTGAEKPGSFFARSPSYGHVMQQCINASLARPLTLEQLAQAVALSPFTASRIFHRESGLPLRIYTRRLRLRTALAHIADCHPFSQVALELGFFDHSHFANAFRTEFGITASQWREYVVAALGKAA